MNIIICIIKTESPNLITIFHIISQRRVSMNELLTPVANVGFPIVLSIYLLLRLEGKIEGLSASVHELAKSITVMGNRE